MNMAMPNTNKILLGLTVVLLLVVGKLLYWQKSSSRPPDYYAVMTSSGDLFFGELKSWKGESLTNVWTLQKTGDEKNPVSLVKFDQSIFGPEDRLELNPENILWKTKLKADSQVVAQMKNPTPPQQMPPTVSP